MERNCVEVVQLVKSIVIKPNTALKLSATRQITDVYGKVRQAGEEWLIREEGSYLPQMYEQFKEIVKGVVLTHKKAQAIQAIKDFTDVYGNYRRAGERWLVTYKDAQIHVFDVYEQPIKTIYATTLSNR